MTTPQAPYPIIQPNPGTRLDQLLCLYRDQHPAAAEATKALDATKASIKAELQAIAPGVDLVMVTHPELRKPLKLERVERTALNGKRLEEAYPAIAEQFRETTDRWELRGV